MLYLYQSNHLENLAKALITLVETRPLRRVLSLHNVLIDDPLLKQWFEHYHAAEKGISTGLNLLSFKQYLEATCPAASSNNHFLLEQGVLFWRLVNLLLNTESLNDREQVGLANLSDYISSNLGSDKRVVQLAGAFVERLGEYASTRPDWLDAFSIHSSGLHFEGAQHQFGLREDDPLLMLTQSLWTLGQADSHWNNPYVFNRDRIWESSAEREALQEDLYILLPKIGYEHEIQWILQHAESANVHLFCWNPSRHFWLDRSAVSGGVNLSSAIGNASDAAQTSDPIHIEQKAPDAPYHVVLDKWGGLALAHLLPWIKIDNTQELDIDLYSDPVSDSLLHQLQLDVLNGHSDTWQLKEDDKSLQIMRCGSRDQEVTVLCEHLHHLLRQNLTLSPEDILVLAPKPSDYAATIKRVFESYSAGDRDHYLPINLPHSPLVKEQSLHAFLTEILSLSECRLDGAELMRWLDFDILISALDLGQAELEQIQLWLKQMPHIWGLDSLHQALWNFDDSSTLRAYHWNDLIHHTWSRYLYDKPKAITGVQGPYLDVSGKDQLAAFSKWIRLFELLEVIWADMQVERSAQAWCDCVLEWLNLLLEKSGRYQEAKESVVRYLTSLSQSAKVAESNQDLSWQAFFWVLQQYLDQNASSLRLSPGKINVCSITQAGLLPAKVVYILGMNEGEFPRVQSRKLFDLLAEEAGARQGDHSVEEQDRYAFLQRLMSTESQLFLSYKACDKGPDDEAFPADVLVELEAFVVHKLGSTNSATVQQFYRQCVQEHMSPSIQASHYDPKNSPLGFPSYDHYGALAFNEFKASKRISSGHSEDHLKQIDVYRTRDLTWRQWIDQLINPLGHFYSKQYAVAQPNGNEFNELNDPFNLEGLERYRIRQQSTWMDASEFEQYRDYESKVSASAAPSIVTEQMNREHNIMSPLREALLALGELKSEQTAFQIKECTIQHSFWVTTTQEMIWPVYSRHLEKDFFRAWVCHVMRACMMNQSRPSLILGMEKRIILPELSRDLAQEYRHDLIARWQLDQTEPNLFFPKTAYAQLFGSERDIRMAYLNDGTMGGAIGEAFQDLLVRAINSSLTHYNESILDEPPDQSTHPLFSQILHDLEAIRLERL